MITIGIDAGTSVIKAVAFDDDGAELASATRLTRVHSARPGWSEQDMPETLESVIEAVAAVAAQLPAQPGALALTAQGDGLWLTDGTLAPAGPALLWNDSRAAAIFDRWWQDGVIAETFPVTGSVGGPGSPHALLSWLRAHDPARLAQATALDCSGWLFSQFTGRLVIDRSDACSPLGDLRKGSWSPDALRAFGLTWAEPMLPEVVDGRDRIGALAASAAERMGLPAGLPVVVAPYDVVSTAHGAGVLRPGDAVLILGTTLCAGLLAPDPALDRKPSGVTLTAGVPGQWMLAEPALAGTGVLSWAAALLGLKDPVALTELAGTADRSAPRPLVLPYTAPGGERAPFYDPAVSGAVLGLRSWHGPADLALAVLEGLALAGAECLRTAGQPARVFLAGGGQRSRLWCQFVADCCALPVVSLPGTQPGARGAAMCARVLLGEEPEWPALGRWFEPGETWEPDPGQAVYWAGMRQRFSAVREAIQFSFDQSPRGSTAPASDDPAEPPETRSRSRLNTDPENSFRLPLFNATVLAQSEVRTAAGEQLSFCLRRSG